MSNFKVPQPGQVITVTSRYPDHYYLNDKRYKDITYKNVPVIEPQSWTKPGEFCIPAEGEPFIKFHTINISRVIALTIEGQIGEVETSISTEYKKIPGGHGKTYTVTVVNGLATACECLGFQYRRQCRHLRIAMGLTPVNPRRETIKKQQKKDSVRACYSQPRGNGHTKASIVRNLIRKYKNKHNESWIAEKAVEKLGMSRSLATTYVRNNWDKV